MILGKQICPICKNTVLQNEKIVIVNNICSLRVRKSGAFQESSETDFYHYPNLSYFCISRDRSGRNDVIG